MNPPETDRSLKIHESQEAARRECAKRSLPGAMVFFLVAIVVWMYTDYAAISPSLMLWLAVLLFVLGAVRTWTSLLLMRRPFGVDNAAIRWAFYGSIMGSFGVWGIFSGYTAYEYVMNPKGLLVLLSAAALVAGASASLAPDRWLGGICVLLLSLPVIWGAMLRPEPEAHAFALLSTVYTLFLLVQIQLNWKSFWTARQVHAAELARLEAVRFASEKSLLLATMSHEVRTPMNGVIGMIDLVLSTSNLSTEAREYASHARTSALNLLGVLNGILSFSRNEKAGVLLSPVDFDMVAWLRQVAFPFAWEAEKKGIRMDVEIDLPAPCWFRADPVRLSEVLTNLLSNAVKFTQTGGVTLRVAREGVDAVQFVISDTGPGIPPVVQAQLFEPFSHSAVAAGRQGTGLGLAICRQIVVAMRGKIDVRSGAEKGTEFTVTIPMTEVEAPAAVSAAPLLNAYAEGYSGLVVEDDPVSGLVARRLLEKMGIHVDIATSCAEALRYAARRYDIFLLDVHLPDGDGLDLATQLRATEAHRDAVIVVVSAGEAEELENRGRQTGINAFLAKPYTSEQLTDVLRLVAPH